MTKGIWALSRRPFVPPQKALILKPCCMSQVMLATPLLAELSNAYPRARFDWAVSEWARPAIASNPRLTELISTGCVGLGEGSWRDVRKLAGRLRQEQYDTCFIPSRSSLLSLVAWLAGIPQRVGLNVKGRGFAHKLAVRPPDGERHEAAVYLALARALGIETEAGMEFYPSDAERTVVSQRLVDEVDWLGDVPLIISHPGGGSNPVRQDERKCWPVERFVLLANHLIRRHQARVLLVGAERDKPLSAAVSGLMSKPVVDLAGRLSLGELGALCEVADLYVGNDSGPTHVAAAVGCPTLAIFGPSDPAVSGPYCTNNRVVTLWREPVHELWRGPDSGLFSWKNGVSAEEAIAAAEELLVVRQKQV